jgi:hypothetical protein
MQCEEVSRDRVPGGLDLARHNELVAAQLALDPVPALATRHFDLVSGDFYGVSTAPVKLRVHVGHRFDPCQQ